jgi:hypothetical protein
MDFDGEIVIYEWHGWLPFLLPTLFPQSKRIQAKLEDWDSNVIAQLPPGTKLFAFHLNMTHTAGVPHHRSSLCLQLEKNGILTLNADATNTSKAFIQSACQRLGLQTTLAPKEGDPEEKLIIKTNWNYGGIGESMIDTHTQRLLGLASYSNDMDARSYRILLRNQVAPEVWLRSDLIVERFVENNQDLFFRAYWLCDRLVISEVIDPMPLKKMGEGIKRKNWFFKLSGDAVIPQGEPSSLAQILSTKIALFMQGAHFDFGTLDIVVDDDFNLFIVDVNTTPSWRATSDDHIIAFLRAAEIGCPKQSLGFHAPAAIDC